MQRLAATLMAAVGLTAAPVAAAELEVIAAGAVRGVIGEMADDYTGRTGTRLRLRFGPTGQVRDAVREALASHRPVDLVVASAPLMAEFEAAGAIAPGSRVDLGRVGLGLVVASGAPVPDLSTPEAVKRALLDAKAIAFTDPKLGASSTGHLMKLADSFGIRDAVMRKAVLASGGNDAAAKVADGRADLAIAPISDIHAKDAKLAGPLPDAIQLWTVYAAAVHKTSANPAAARAFLAALTAEPMQARWIKAGWRPAPLSAPAPGDAR